MGPARVRRLALRDLEGIEAHCQAVGRLGECVVPEMEGASLREVICRQHRIYVVDAVDMLAVYRSSRQLGRPG